MCCVCACMCTGVCACVRLCVPKENKFIFLVLGDIRKIKTVRYCHKIPRYDDIVIATKF